MLLDRLLTSDMTIDHCWGFSVSLPPIAKMMSYEAFLGTNSSAEAMEETGEPGDWQLLEKTESGVIDRGGDKEPSLIHR